MTLTAYTNNGLKLLIDNNTGEVFATIKATAKIIHADKSTVSRYVNADLPTFTAMILKEVDMITSKGFKSYRLLNESQILDVIYRYNPKLVMKFALHGLRPFLHQLVGYDGISVISLM